MTKKKGLLNTSRLTNYIYLFVALFLMNPISAYGEGFEEENHFRRTTKARLAVEKAWDVYHDGALGGTLQSPKVQTKLEMDLHQSRALLAEAYEAEDKGDLNKTKDLIQNIMLITHRVISESKVQKK